MSGFLQITGLRREFGGLTAVCDVDMEAGEGQVTGLIGPNGAGKTTLFSMIAGALKPTRGSIRFRGRPLEGRSEPVVVRAGIARTFQNARLFPALTVRENVLVGASVVHRGTPIGAILGSRRCRRDEREARERADDLLAFLGLEADADRLPGELPYGSQRRVAIARALASGPSLLLLDEPAAGMNNQETAELRDLLLALRDERGISVLVIEHDMSLVMTICDRLVVLDHGECIARGTPAAIQNDPRVMEAYLGGGDARASRRQQRLRRAVGA